MKGNEGINGDYILKVEHLELKNITSEMKIFLDRLKNKQYTAREKMRELGDMTI